MRFLPSSQPSKHHALSHCQSDGWKMVFWCSFNLHLFYYKKKFEHLSICLSSTCISCLVNYLFISVTYFPFFYGVVSLLFINFGKFFMLRPSTSMFYILICVLVMWIYIHTFLPILFHLFALILYCPYILLPSLLSSFLSFLPCFL